MRIKSEYAKAFFSIVNGIMENFSFPGAVGKGTRILEDRGRKTGSQNPVILQKDV